MNNFLNFSSDTENPFTDGKAELDIKSLKVRDLTPNFNVYTNKDRLLIDKVEGIQGEQGLQGIQGVKGSDGGRP